MPISAQVHAWTQEFVAQLAGGPPLRAARRRRSSARSSFMSAIGVDMRNPSLHQTDIWTSHEALLLDFEEALTRRDSLTGDWYDCSAHFLWVGDRTRQPDGAHVQFLAGVHNPLGVEARADGDARGDARALRGAQPRAHPGPADADRADGRAARRGEAAAARPRGARCRPPGRLGLRPDAREHVPDRRRPEDARLRPHRRRDRGLLRRAPRRGHLARRRPPRDHRRRRHRVPRRERQPLRGAARRRLHDALRPPPERPPVARPRLPGRRADARRADAPRAGRNGADGRVASARGEARRRRAGRRASTRTRRSAGDRARARGGRRGGLARRDRSPSADLAVVAAPVTVLPALVEDVLARTGDRTHGHRHRLDEGLVGQAPGAVRRRPSGLRPRGARRRRTRPPSCSTARPGS